VADPTTRRFLAVCLLVVALAGCAAEGTGPAVRLRVARGTGFSEITDSLAAKGLIRNPFAFKIYAKLTGASSSAQPGVYEFKRGTGWSNILSDLRAGRVLSTKLVIPEGFELREIAPRIATVTGQPVDSVLAILRDSATARRFAVPGPNMEGYLYPATHTFRIGLALDTVISQLVAPYRRVWNDERRAAAAALRMTEQQVTTLASIIEAEAKKREEMPVISSVYHNRLRIRMPLQADPTVQYALAERQARLRYSDIASTAGSSYSTYSNRGLPPGPIGSPSSTAIDAALHPAQTDFLYFVARPDGTSVFSRSLTEHNRAKVAIRRMQAASQSAADTAAARKIPRAAVQAPR
jgi:UPF0755 protein